MGVARATAIAVANAAVRHLELGLFMSEYNGIDEQSLRFSKFAGNARYGLSGRTTSGQWVLVHVTLIYKKLTSSGKRDGNFPIERAYAVVSKSTSVPPTYLQCTFSGDDFQFGELDDSVLKEDGKLAAWQIDESSDALVTRYPPE